MYIAIVNFLWPSSGPMKSIPLLLAFTASALGLSPVRELVRTPRISK